MAWAKLGPMHWELPSTPKSRAGGKEHHLGDGNFTFKDFVSPQYRLFQSAKSLHDQTPVIRYWDGPQLKSRRPAQYASNLADDPGSGVPTFTSFGLIDRSNKEGHFPESNAIALEGRALT